MDARLRAVCDLLVPTVREEAGRHEYDGAVQDLSPDGVRAALARLDAAAAGPAPDDPHDAAHLAVFEEALRVRHRRLELHRRDPYPHLANLELACYERPYAPAEQRAAARRRHLARWPDAIDAALESLDAVTAPVARALLGTARGLAADVRPDDGDLGERALRAHAALVAHLEHAALHGPPRAALGGPALAALMGSAEGVTVDLGRLAERADAERRRLTELLRDACARVEPGTAPAALLPRLFADHPEPGAVLAEARSLARESIAFTRERHLVPYVDGECEVVLPPPSRRWVTAMMVWNPPGEPDAPSRYLVTPPDPGWEPARAEEWLTRYSRTTLPAITVHEVAPGHFAHGRTLRRLTSPVRRTLHSLTFMEGWAHYAEEVCLEEGFRSGDPRFAVGVAVEALVRVTRLACAIGLHTGAMDVEEATARFMSDAHLAREAAAAEARRGTFDATYGRYTWGKFALLDLRERARREPGSTLPAFHATVLALGCPPIGLLDRVLDTPRRPAGTRGH
ncbi:DUF885 family protein [Streptantibioticus cattleyicolor]|uniref:Putative secreted protein n=1 Tax=Streptantibioticus cattleyicolor (strain ATCC 35852 / DSM 46488 / JCM 4925 / NBRC 14057 / NRRL 8057) TaxID=1003195 RepID=F8JMQ8_STREN|nr:DUF885 family protein [Streptantibioticus cattleyicolor]AEW99307.1 putative secreted protein [Streptantibioticus cattleyicolor NRRL 8057 = DSM 46488]CCB71654.1 conserved protein of unknown function [Streptantibioticus cattleyicolor NRRL 8057 = DSM 46488]